MSWIVVKDGQAQFETFDKDAAAYYHKHAKLGVEVIPVFEWLHRVNLFFKIQHAA